MAKTDAEITIIIPDNSSLKEVNELAKVKGFANIREMIITELKRQIAAYQAKMGSKIKEEEYGNNLEEISL